MNSQRGKASTKASNTKRQARKSQTNASKNNNNNNKKRNISYKSSSIDASVSFLDNASVAYSQGQSTQTARISRMGANTRIIHREQIDTVTVYANDFTIDGTYSVNPGLYASFPWLSTQAAGWEKYRFNRLRFVYYPRCPTSTTGSVMLSPDFESSDNPPGSLQAASSNIATVEDAAWKTITLNVPREHLNVDRFIRDGPRTVNTDIRLTDVANVYLITSDATVQTNTGKLWVEYDVTFMIPSNHLQPYLGFAQYGVSPTVTPAAIFGPTTILYSRDASLEIAGGSLIMKNLKVGNRYNLHFSIIGTGITVFNIGSVSGASLSNTVPAVINAGATNATCGGWYIASATTVAIVINYTVLTVASSAFCLTNADYYQI